MTTLTPIRRTPIRGDYVVPNIQWDAAAPPPAGPDREASPEG